MKNFNDHFKKELLEYCSQVSYNNFIYGVNISLKNNYIFVETPKVACSTLKSIFQSYELLDPEYKWTHSNWVHLRSISPLLNPLQVGNLDAFIKKNQPYIFCFVRNPYSRVLSAYLDKIEGNQKQKVKLLERMGRDSKKLKQEVSFEDFVKTICATPVKEMNSHWRVQYYQLSYDKFKYDFIGKFENLNEDLETVLDKLQIDKNLYYREHRPHSTGSTDKLKQYYTTALVELVREKYEMDFKTFGYSMEL